MTENQSDQLDADQVTFLADSAVDVPPGATDAAVVDGPEASQVTHSGHADDAVDGEDDDDADGAADDDAEDDDAEDDEESDGHDASGTRRRSNRSAQLEAEGDIAADYLEELLDIADLDGDIDTYTEGGRAHVSIVTDADLLVGKDGEVLNALQELSRLAVMTETGHRSRLMLDIAGFRDRQRKDLRNLALDAIAEVKETGEPVALAPMNPFERKVVHDAVAEAGLVSESEGVEPRRRVVVKP